MKEIITEFTESFKLFLSEQISTSERKLNDNTLFSFSFPNETLDFDILFEKIKLFSPSFIFEKPDENFRLLAFDSAYNIGKDSYNTSDSISSVINELRKNTIENWGDEFKKYIPLFVGGMKFLTYHNSDLWKDFNQSNWFVPKYLFIKKGGFSGLIFNSFYKSLKNIDEIRLSIQNDLCELFEIKTAETQKNSFSITK